MIIWRIFALMSRLKKSILFLSSSFRLTGLKNALFSPWTNFLFDLLICKVSREPWNIKGAVFHPSAILNQHFSWLAPPGYIKLHDNYPIIIIIRHFRNFFQEPNRSSGKPQLLSDCLTGNKTILRFSQTSVASIKVTIMQRIGPEWHKDSRGWVGKIMKKKITFYAISWQDNINFLRVKLGLPVIIFSVPCHN